MKKSHKLLLLLALVCTLSVCGIMSASADYRNNFYYTVTDSNVTIDYLDPYQTFTGEIIIPETIDGYPVTAIGDEAFKERTGLTSVVIPESVTTIGKSAFEGCTGLTGITIPDSVTGIGDYAFYNCTGLTGITMSKWVTSMGKYAFSGCTGLTDITIPFGVSTIGESAFAKCTGLTSVTVADSVTSIGEYAFDGCKLLAEFTVPASVTSISDYTFRNCYAHSAATILPKDKAFKPGSAEYTRQLKKLVKSALDGNLILFEFFPIEEELSNMFTVYHGIVITGAYEHPDGGYVLLYYDENDGSYARDGECNYLYVPADYSQIYGEYSNLMIFWTDSFEEFRSLDPDIENSNIFSFRIEFLKHLLELIREWFDHYIKALFVK